MTENAERLEHVLAAQVGSAATSVVDAQLGKKRWLFYFEDGALVGSRSNLKSEGIDALRESKPDMDPDRLLLLQVVRRVRNALRSADTWAVKKGSPKERVRIETGVAIVKGIAGARDAGELDALLAGAVSPAAREGLDALGLSRRHASWLAGADGSLDCETLVAGAPGKPEEAKAALFLALQAGAVGPTGAPSAEAAAASADEEGEPSAGAVEPASEEGGGLLSSLIAEGVAEVVAANPPDPNDQKGFVPDSAPKNPLNEVTFEDDIGIELLGEDGPAPAPAPGLALPTFTQRVPEEAPKHPLEDNLRAIHERVMSAEDHFTVFELEWDAEAEAFRLAHLELARQLHPDRFADATPELQDVANEAFDRVREAWEVLGEPGSREAYIDRVVHGKQTEEELAMAQVEAFWKAESEFKRGLAVFNQGRIKQAHEFFRSAHEAVPDELEFSAYFAFTTFKQAHQKGDEMAAEEAKETLKDVLEKNKEQERKLDGAWVLAGIVYRDLGNDKAAKSCLVHALKLNPSNADANRELRRITGKAPGQKKPDTRARPKDEKKGSGFFSRLFGGGKDE
ncbi:MAG: J domain-containing protein [Myxococcota bacterium]|nr:J domain-containing protein [Myxococcota bacterium]MEC8422929.1 J domain-containing protein [Myxococcota bacterium]